MSKWRDVHLYKDWKKILKIILLTLDEKKKEN
jgi:hypothetical protein